MTHTEWIPFHMVLALKWHWGGCVQGLGWGCEGWSESVTQFVFALTVPLAGWPEGQVPSQGGCFPGGWQCPSLAVPRARGAGGGSCETGLPSAKADGPPMILGHAGPVLGRLVWISVFPQAAEQCSWVQFMVMLYGKFTCTSDKTAHRVPECPSLSWGQHWTMRGWAKEVTVQSIPSLSMLN